MTKYIKNHEHFIHDMMANSIITTDIIDLHRRQIHYLQQERLVHLIVTCLVSVLLFLTFALLLLKYSEGIVVLFFIFLILDAFYLRHYYFLENTVQKWYVYDIQLSLNK